MDEYYFGPEPEPAISEGTNSQYWRGDKTWQTFLGETSATAYRGDRGKTAYDHSQVAGGDSVHVSTTENTNWDAAYSHISNDGSDHSFINQDVTTTSSPTFVGLGAQTLTTTGIGTLGGLTVQGVSNLIYTASENDTYSLKIDTIVGGYGDVKTIDIDYVTGAISAGEDEAVILVNVDEISSTGGDVFGIEILSTEGSGAVYGIKAGATVGPIHQDSGTFANPTTGTDNTASTDVPAMIDGDTGTTTAIFENDNEYIIIGAAAAFQEIEIVLTTDASVSIKPTFAYSTAGSGQFTAFSPVDGTNGFRNTGIIAWDASDLTGHTTNDDTGTYDIKITRTRNAMATSPVLGYAKFATTTEYLWDKSGNINSLSYTDGVATISGGNILTTGTLGAGQATITKMNLGGGLTAFVLNGVSLNAIVGATSQLATELQYVALQHSNTPAAGSRFMLSRSRGTLANPLIVVENDVIAAIDAAAYDGTDYVLAGQIDFEVDGEPGGNDMPGRIVFKTTADGGILPGTRWTIKSTGHLLSGADGTGAYNITTAGTITALGLTATGTVTAGVVIVDSVLALNSNQITSTTGTVDFSDDHLTTTGNISGADITGSGALDISGATDIHALNCWNTGRGIRLTVARDSPSAGICSIYYIQPSGTVWKKVHLGPNIANKGLTLDCNTGYAGIGTNSPVVHSDVRGNARVGDGTNYTQISSTGNVTFAGTAGFYPRRVNQSAEPAAGTGSTQIDTGEMIMWRDTDDGKVYLVYRDTDSGIVKIELV